MQCAQNLEIRLASLLQGHVATPRALKSSLADWRSDSNLLLVAWGTPFLDAI